MEVNYEKNIKSITNRGNGPDHYRPDHARPGS
jgi:hypothetical protein